MAGKGPAAATRRWATQYISGPRFEPYLRACGGNHTAAMKLYGWNDEAVRLEHHYVWGVV